MSVPGGLGPRQKANKEVQNICDQVKSQAEAKAGTKFSQYEAIFYRTQIVAGTNYFIKVHVGGIFYVLLRVYQKLPVDGSTLELTDIKSVTKDEPIDYFP